MVTLFAKLFIKDYKNTSSPAVRQKYGILCGGCGIALNILLFALKLAAGAVSGSVAVTADAFNNISDAGSSAVSMIGFRLAGKRPDPEHPFGHGRIEYISGLVVAMLIFVMGFELATSSFSAILNPVQTKFSIVSVSILAISVLVKLYMFFYNRAIGKKIDSASMKATAFDSLGDTVSTIAVIASLAVSHFTGLLIDGYVGLIVAGLIFAAGYRSAKETIEPLLGTPPERELVENIEKTVLSHSPITGVHDLILHDYGPGRKFLSLHAEVPMAEDILFVHDVVDNVEIEIYNQFGIEAVIHMDPIDTSDPRLNEIKETVHNILDSLGEGFKAHDFRLVPGNTHTNIVFDIAVPVGCKTHPDAVKLAVAAAVSAMNPQYRCVIKTDILYA